MGGATHKLCPPSARLRCRVARLPGRRRVWHDVPGTHAGLVVAAIKPFAGVGALAALCAGQVDIVESGRRNRVGDDRPAIAEHDARGRRGGERKRRGEQNSDDRYARTPAEPFPKPSRQTCAVCSRHNSLSSVRLYEASAGADVIRQRRRARRHRKSAEISTSE